MTEDRGPGGAGFDGAGTGRRRSRRSVTSADPFTQTARGTRVPDASHSPPESVSRWRILEQPWPTAVRTGPRELCLREACFRRRRGWSPSSGACDRCGRARRAKTLGETSVSRFPEMQRLPGRLPALALRTCGRTLVTAGA